MSQSFPTSVPTYPDTQGTEVLGSAGSGKGLSGILDDYGLDVIALTQKVGTGSSTATSGTVLRGTGAGTTAYGAVVLTTDVSGTLPVANGGTGITSLGSGVATFLGTPSSANLASAVTGETGSGALVFGTSPTIAAPVLSGTTTGTYTLGGTPTITAPTIADFTNAQHDHGDADDGGALAAGSVGNTQLATGAPVQMVSTSSTEVATGTTTIPQDDTIPQNTEGTEFITQAITPKSATNILVIEVIALLGCDTAGRNIIGAIFQDTTANALAANIEYNDNASSIIPSIITVRHTMVAGTTSSTTFKFRAGAQAAATVTFNGNNSARLFGAITKSSIVITEYKAA